MRGGRKEEGGGSMDWLLMDERLEMGILEGSREKLEAKLFVTDVGRRLGKKRRREEKRSQKSSKWSVHRSPAISARLHGGNGSPLESFLLEVLEQLEKLELHTSKGPFFRG